TSRRLQETLYRATARGFGEQFQDPGGVELATGCQHPGLEPRPAGQSLHRVAAFRAARGVEVLAKQHRSDDAAKADGRPAEPINATESALHRRLSGSGQDQE